VWTRQNKGKRGETGRLEKARPRIKKTNSRMCKKRKASFRGFVKQGQRTGEQRGLKKGPGTSFFAKKKQKKEVYSTKEGQQKKKRNRIKKKKRCQPRKKKPTTAARGAGK